MSSVIGSCATSNLTFPGQLKIFDKEDKCSFGTTLGQYMILAALLLVGLLPSVILSVKNIWSVVSTSHQHEENLFVERNVQGIGHIVQDVGDERTLSTLYIITHKVSFQQLQRQRAKVNRSIDILYPWPKVSNKNARFIGRSGEELKANLSKIRRLVDAKIFYHTLEKFSYINFAFIRTIDRIVDNKSKGDQWQSIYAYLQISYLIETLSIKQYMGCVYLIRGKLSRVSHLYYIKTLALIDVFGKNAQLLFPEVQELLDSDKMKKLMAEIDKTSTLVVKNQTIRPSMKRVTRWLEVTDKFVHNIKELQNSLEENIHQYTVQAEADHTRAVSKISVMTVIEAAVYPVYVALTIRMVFKMKQVSSHLSQKTKKLTKERNRRIKMVKEMYPSSVGDRLLLGEEVEPQSFDQATVCFAVVSDIKSIVASCSPLQVVRVVNSIFDEMDEEIIKYDMFKLETMEDMFLLVSGVPIPNGTDHVIEIASMCINLRDRMSAVAIKHLAERGVRIRFGVCTGPVAAGIVGHKMPRYLLFGNTINIASRMQSTSTASDIQLDPTAGDLLTKLGGYKLERRRGVKVKGRGLMDTYLLMSRSISRHASLSREDSGQNTFPGTIQEEGVIDL